MKEEYLLTVRGTQLVDGEEETEELTTTAEYTERDGKKLIRYKEYGSNEDTSELVVSNLIKIEPGIVTLIKRIDGRTGQMLFECGQRHQCMYANDVGNIVLGVYTEVINENIGADGGTLEIRYTIDFNGGFESENHITVTLKKTEV